jgi:AcrR family transcriptional regulator
MIEAVSLCGYERASVRQVIGLAGVSRRSFYEQFPNKQECFMATFDMLATRGIRAAAESHLATDGDFAERLNAGFRTLCAKIEEAPKAASLVLAEAETAGAGGSARVHASLTACERLLARAFTSSRDAHCPSAPIIRAITGGLHGTLAQAVRGSDLHARAEPLAERLTTWTTLFARLPAESEELLATRLRVRMREISLASAHSAGTATREGDERTRILHEALRLGALHEHSDLSAPQIADEAGVPIEAFLELFATREECYTAALEMVAETLLGALGDTDRSGGGQWPNAVRRATAGLLSCLGENPVYARTIAQSAFAAGSAPAARALELFEAVAARLLAGAPGDPDSGPAPQAIAGALAHTGAGARRSHTTAGGALGAPRLRRPRARSRRPRRARGAFASRSGRAHALRLAALAPPAFGEVGEHDADEQRDDDHDDQRCMTRPDDPVDLDFVEVQHGEQRDQHRQEHQGAGARALPRRAPLCLLLRSLGAGNLC